jgi:hypothetical protein
VGRTRAARLRGYGNAIVLPLASTFVGAVIAALSDAARETASEADPASGVKVVVGADPSTSLEVVGVPEPATTAEDHAA